MGTNGVAPNGSRAPDQGKCIANSAHAGQGVLHLIIVEEGALYAEGF